MINKLTGEPVSAEMQNVLKRLANSENVPEAEIQQLKEIREANSCLGNGVPTVKLKDREGIQNGVYNLLQKSGSAVTDESGHVSLTGEIRREKRLDIVIGFLLRENHLHLLSLFPNSTIHALSTAMKPKKCFQNTTMAA